MRTALFLAKRHFLGERNFYTRLFSIFAVAGIAMGVFAMIVVLGVMKGFEGTVRKKILGINAHMLVFLPQTSKTSRIKEELGEIKGVVKVFPYVQTQSMVISKFGSRGCILRGMDKDFFRYLVGEGYLKAGSPPGKGGIILGEYLARNLGVSLGDTVRVVFPSGEFYLFGFIPKMREFKVSGIFKVGLYDFDSGMVFGRLRDVMDLAGLAYPSSFEVDVKDPGKVDEVKKAVLMRIPEASVFTWKELNKNLFSAMKLERIAMFIILLFMSCIASFSVVASLFFKVMAKKKDIAVLKVFGATSSFVRRLFLIEGFFIGAAGAFIGLVMGSLAIFFVERFKLIRLPADVYLISYLPAKFSLFYSVLTVFSALFISVLGALFPADWASRVEPSKILRFE